MTQQRLFTADIVVLCRAHILLIQRGREPYAGQWALPGGKRNAGESLDTTAMRELREETGLQITAAQLQHVGYFDTPGRDPRGDVVCTAFLVRLEVERLPAAIAGDDAGAAQWFSITRLPARLAFDHREIIERAMHLEAERLADEPRQQITACMIHEAFMETEARAMPWQCVGAMERVRYLSMARNLNEQLARIEEDRRTRSALGEQRRAMDEALRGVRVECASCHMLIDPDSLKIHECPPAPGPKGVASC